MVSGEWESEKALNPTKLHIPVLHGNLVNRMRLIQQLNSGFAQNCRLTLISAPAGYGKSTLISEWLSQADVPAAWLSLEQAENIPLSFLVFLRHGAQHHSTILPNRHW
jgi:LuxR family transcriptional regulator, maltose regulon positive regulatory protein